MALSKVQSNSLATTAITDKLGFTPANASAIVLPNGQITSTSASNTNTGSANAWVNVNTAVYKWDLPSTGRYFLYTSIRTRLWGVTGFLKCRLLNNTTSSAISNTDKMLQEFQGTNTTNNIQLTPVWQIDITAASTIYLQFWSTMTGEVGIQSDSNGWNDTGWIKLS